MLPREAVSAMDRILIMQKEPVREILLGTCGSILDHTEMSVETLMAILEKINSTDIRTVIFETHYVTVDETILNFLSDHLPGREIMLELGLESSNPDVLENSLGKYMNLTHMTRAIDLIHSHGMGVILNVFIGAPFLSPEEQIQDVLDTCRWAVDHGADRVALFPANLRPNTLLWKLWEEQKYERISHWLVIEILNRMPDDVLAKTELCWYGDRQEAGRDVHVVSPDSCDGCHGAIMEFYEKFLSDFSVPRRRELIRELLKQKTCECPSYGIYQERKV